jgi:hypothetical protein
MTQMDMPSYAMKLWEEMQGLPAGQLIMKIENSGFVVWQSGYRDRGGRLSPHGYSKRHSAAAGEWLLQFGFCKLENGALVPVVMEATEAG